MSRQLTARHSHCAWVSRGKLHVWGGCVESQSDRLVMERHGEETKRLTKVVQQFDINGSREWTSVITSGNDRPLGIRNAALALLGVDDTRAIFFGGYCGHGACCFHNSLHELDTNSWEWNLLIPDMKDQESFAPMMKRNSGAVGFSCKGKNYVCVFAGLCLSGSSQYQDYATYETEKRKGECATNELHCAEINGHEAEWFWPNVTGTLPPPCVDFSFIKTSDLGVVMAGGHVNSASLNDSVYHLNLDNWEWSKIFSSPGVLRTYHFSTLLAPDKILTMGGADEKGTSRSNMCIIDLIAGSTEMVPADSKTCRRQWHTITAIPTNESGTAVSVVVIGGVTTRVETSDPTVWPKAETNIVMEFGLIKAQDGTDKWRLNRTRKLNMNITKYITSELSDLTSKQQTDLQAVVVDKTQPDEKGIQTDLQAVDVDKTQLDGIQKELEYHKRISRAKDRHIEDIQKRVKSLEDDCTKYIQQLSSIKEVQQSEKDTDKMQLTDAQSQLAEMRTVCEGMAFENLQLKEQLEMNVKELSHEKLKDPAATRDCAIQADYLSVTRDSVMAVDELAETVMEIVGGKHQTLKWLGHGFRLTVPAEAVPAGTTISLAVKALLEGEFELPENLQLFSTIYWIATSQELSSSVTLHLQHCALIESETQSTEFQFVAGRCSQAGLPYLLKIVKGGVFTPHSQEAFISVKQFSFFGIAGPSGTPSLYYQQLFCRPVGGSYAWKLEYLVTCYIESHLEWVKNEYEEKGWTQQYKQLLQFDEPKDDLEQSITLAIREADSEQQKMWIIQPLDTCQIMKWTVDHLEKKMPFPVCQLAVTWRGEDRQVLPDVSRRVDLDGAKHPYNYFFIKLPEQIPVPLPSVQAPKTTVITAVDQPVASLDTLPEGKLGSSHLSTVLVYLEEQGVVGHWKKIGVLLKLPYADMELIEKNYAGEENRVMTMLNQWLTSGTAVKQVLVDALKRSK